MTIYKLNPWLLVATLLLFAKISFSQKDSLLKCKDTDKQGIYYNNTIAYLKKKENLRPQLKYPINVALSVKLIRKSDGSGGIDESQVRRVIDNLNSVYLQANIGFFLLNDKVEFINNDNYYVFNTEDEDKLTSKYDVRNAINLYLVNSFEESIGGYAYFPSTMKNSNRVFCYYADVEDMIYKVVPHEMGHYFGLFHTFQGNFSVDEELVSRGENGNCEFAGDLICDTPADPYGKVIFLGGVDCGFNYIFTDKSGENYHPQTGNLMSYYRNCGNFFTPGQYELLSYGISKRLAPNTNSEVRYNILGRQEIDSTLITTGKLQSKDGGIYNSSICRNQEVYLSYTLKSKKNIPVEAWLITDNNKIRIKVGEGTESPLKLNFEKLPSIPFNFFLQVVATDESQFGTFSDQYYKLLEIPKIEIQGSDEIFKGEQAVILVKINTAIANFKILNEYNEGVNYFHSGIPNKIQLKIPTSNSSQFKITSVSNECGVGTGTGVFDVKIIPVPLSKFVKLYRQDDFICKGRDLQFTVVGDGKIPEIKSINLVENDSQNGIKITSYSLSNDLLTIPAAEIQNSFAERFSLVIDFENLGIVSSKIIHKLSDINLDLSQVVKFKRGKEYKINLPGYYTPTEVLLSNNNSLNISGNAAFLSFVLFENQTINISKSNTNGCQVVNLTGTIQFKTDDLLEFDLVRKEEVCVNQKISLPVSKIQGIFGNQPTVIFYDELNRQSSGTSSHLSNENILTFVIPETLKSDGYYYFRIMTVDSLLSKKSNLFYINTLPNINISGVYSSKYQNQNLIKEVKGTLPIEVIFDDDKTFKIFTTNDILSPSNFSEGQHNIKQLKNICGTFSPNQIFVIANEIPSPNCTSIGNPDKYFIPVSKFEISQQYQDNMPVFSREDWPHQTNGYNDFTNKIIYLKKNTPYNFYLETYVEKNLSYGSTNYTQLKSWIDYNNNGVFEDKEEIIYSTEAFRTKKTIIIPENVKPGFRLLRIKTISQNSTSYKWDACTADGTGEIEDYLISIQESYVNIPFLNINVNTDKLCITRKLGFIISASNLGHNSFKVSLKDKWGNIIQDLGYYPAGFHETTIKYPVNSNEFLSLMVEDEKNQLQVSSKNFYVIFPPKLTLLGESFGGTGQAQNIFYKCQNGYNTIVTINNAVGNNQFGVYQNYIKNSLNSFSAVINKSGNVYPVAIFDAVCGVGHIEGFTKVTVFDAEPNSKAFSNQSGYGYARCSDGWSINYELNSNIPNEDKNFFSGLLMNENGEFMKNMGNYTKKDIRLSNNTLLPDGMYYANLFAHNPMKSIILDYYDVYKKPKFSMPNNSYNFFVGETGLFEINFNTERTSFNLELSQFQSISAGFVYRFTKKITPSDMVSANSVPNSYYCPATGGTLKQNILAKNKEKNQLKIIADNQFCAGGKTSVPYFKIRGFETDNSFEYSLLDSKNNIVETGNAKEKDGTIILENLKTKNTREEYRIQINSTNPYLASNLSSPFYFKPEVSANITSALTEKEIYENTKIPANIKLTGLGPWNVSLSDNSIFKNISDSSYNTSLISKLGQDSIYITSVSSACGQGNSLGFLKFKIFEIPKIEIAAFSKDTICRSNLIEIEYATVKGKFIGDPFLKLRMYRVGDSSNYEFIKSSNTASGVLKFNLPSNMILGEKYYFKLNHSSPDFESKPSSQFIFNDVPSATILNNPEGFEGFDSYLNVGLISFSPAKLEIENLKSILATTGELLIPVTLKKGTNYSIKSVENSCGTGNILHTTDEGLAIIHQPEEAAGMITIFPNPVTNSDEISRALFDNPLKNIPMTLTIFDEKGNLIKTKKINQQYSDINIKNIDIGLMGAGVYYFHFYNSKISVIKKVIVF